jgi:signal transduction histidine kinase
LVAGLAFWQLWLTWRLTEQDNNLAVQHRKERLEQAADLGMAQLSASLGTWDLILRGMDALPPPDVAQLPAGSTIILIGLGSRVSTWPARSLLFVPNAPSGVILPEHSFADSESLEFRDGNTEGALAALKPLLQVPATHAEALLRIARLERRLGKTAAANLAWRQLSDEHTVNPDGVPYALMAAGALCEIAPSTCPDLRDALRSGRWPLRRETFEYYWGGQELPPKDALDLAELVSELYEHWKQPGSALSGRRGSGDQPLVLWQATRSRIAALFVPAGWLNTALRLPGNALDILWRPADSATNPAVRRSLAEVGLQGRIEFYGGARGEDPSSKRALWLGIVALMLSIVPAGAYALYRGVNRELEVAQLQSDFVSAVSHEFRSPLTSLRGIAELLADGRLTDEGRKAQSYQFLARETGRLQRLVEDLLDFGRMESGKKQYRNELIDAFALVRKTITEFREEARQAGFDLELNLGAGKPSVIADPEALGRAFRNLLENAVKYSLEHRTIRVAGKVEGRSVAISVRDQGMGIEAGEQREVFRKFVRGSAAKRAGIKGTGIGLAMVKQIVDASGGEVSLESEPGVGSVFTITLPVTEGGRE